MLLQVAGHGALQVDVALEVRHRETVHLEDGKGIGLGWNQVLANQDCTQPSRILLVRHQDAVVGGDLVFGTLLIKPCRDPQEVLLIADGGANKGNHVPAGGDRPIAA